MSKEGFNIGPEVNPHERASINARAAFVRLTMKIGADPFVTGELIDLVDEKAEVLSPFVQTLNDLAVGRKTKQRFLRRAAVMSVWAVVPTTTQHTDDVASVANDTDLSQLVKDTIFPASNIESDSYVRINQVLDDIFSQK